jgi:fimbrial chaperone protein
MKRLSRCTSLVAGSIVCLLGLAGPAHASSLNVTPVRVTLDAQHRSVALTLENESDEAKVIQTELVRWTQQDGDNVYAPSHDLLINPPIFTLKPGKRQVIRIGLNRKTDVKNELAYRLRLTEVPPPPKEEFTGLRIALRLDLPVYVQPRETQNNQLNWKASRNTNGEVLLTLSNMSNHHIQLKDIKLNEAAGGCQLVDWQPAGFVLLSGQSRQIRLKPDIDWNAKQLEFTAHINDGLVAAKVELEPTGLGQVAP